MVFKIICATVVGDMLVTKNIVSKLLKAKSILEGGNNKLVLSYQSLRDLGYRKGGQFSMYGYVIFTIVQIIEILPSGVKWVHRILLR